MTREERKAYTIQKRADKKQEKREARELERVWREFLKRIEKKEGLINE